jgi:hypothetical protein
MRQPDSGGRVSLREKRRHWPPAHSPRLGLRALSARRRFRSINPCEWENENLDGVGPAVLRLPAGAVVVGCRPHLPDRPAGARGTGANRTISVFAYPQPRARGPARQVLSPPSRRHPANHGSRRGPPATRRRAASKCPEAYGSVEFFDMAPCDQRPAIETGSHLDVFAHFAGSSCALRACAAALSPARPRRFGPRFGLSRISGSDFCAIGWGAGC